MKKLFGEGGIMGFLSRHCEKIVFGIAVLLVGLGIFRDILNEERKPIVATLGADVLRDKATATSDKLANTNSWDAINEKYKFGKTNIFGKTKQDLEKIDVRLYAARVPLNKPEFPQERPREDSEIYPLEDLHVAVTYGPVALKDPDAVKRGGTRTSADGEVRGFPAEVSEYVARFSMAPAGAKLEGRYVVALTGRIPVRKQKEAFEVTFDETDGYKEGRDTIPVYGAFVDPKEQVAEESTKTGTTTYGMDYFLVERAEVLPDGSLTPYVAAWGRSRYRQGSRFATSLERRWAEGGTVRTDQFVDPQYLDSNFSRRVPPIALRDIAPIATHPLVPTAEQAKESAEGGTESTTPDLLGGGLSGEESGTVSPPAPTRPTPRPTPRPVAGRGGIEGGSYSAGRMEDVEYLLFRYYDMDAEPGKSYRYRVQLIVQDPNFPKDDTERPKTATLAPSVIERLNRRANPDMYWRISGYSKESPIATVPKTRQIIAGPVDPGKVTRPYQRNFEIRQTEKTTKLIALVWDEEKALDVPGVLDASRGTVVDFTADVEAIDPVARGLRQLPSYTFRTDNIVLDIRGGEVNRKEQAIPGEVLLIDGDGNLVVRSELDDAQDFANHTYPKVPAADTGTPLPGGGTVPERGGPPRGGGEIDLFGS